MFDIGDLVGFSIQGATIDGLALEVAVADDTAEQEHGLMGVTDLGTIDGMLFSFNPPRKVSFWMKDTLIPLDLGFFDEDGVLFDVIEMTPCTSDSCPSFVSPRVIRWALEVPAGSLEEMEVGAVLRYPVG